MNLIENYLSEVGQHLPRKTRADIQAEIRSILEDMLEERSKASGHPIDDEMAFEVLKEYGSPRKVAASYAPERYLIGPRLYPVFERVLFVMLPITIVLALVGLAFSLGSTHVTADDFIGLVANTFGSIIWSVITTAGILVLIFAILERSVPEFKMRAKEKEWNPRTLLKLLPRDRISTGNLIAEIIFTMVILLLFDFAWQIFKIGYFGSGNQMGWWVCILCSSPDTIWQTTFLSSAFFQYLPFLNIIWILTIVLDGLLLRHGRWESWLRWASVGIKGLSVLLAAVMLAGPSLIGITTASLTTAGFPATADITGMLITLLGLTVRIVLVLVIVFSGLDIVRTLIRLPRSDRRAVMPAHK